MELQLFFIDSGTLATAKPPSEVSGDESYEDEFTGVDVGDERSDSGGHSPLEASSSRSVSPMPVFAPKNQSLKGKAKKGPAWVDPSDQIVTVSLKDDARLRKLRDGPEDDSVTGREYELKLRRQ